MSSTFLTENKNQKAEKYANLGVVHKEHDKLLAVITAFNSKIDSALEKQRSEYVQAYDHHMKDVQKELHSLREKAAAIANDKTRDEKLKKLDNDQKFYKVEAIRLDNECQELRKHIKICKTNISAVEAERDWLLEKLRKAKVYNTELQNVRSTRELNGLEAGTSMFSNDSSYTFDFNEPSEAENVYYNPKESSTRKLKPYKFRNYDNMVSRNHNERQYSRIFESGGSPGRRTGIAARHSGVKDPVVLSKLVSMRTKKESLRNLVSEAGDNCSVHGVFSRHKPRALPSLIDELLQHVRQSDYAQKSSDFSVGDNFSRASSEFVGSMGEKMMSNGAFRRLIRELASTKDVYPIIQDLMYGYRTQSKADLANPLQPIGHAPPDTASIDSQDDESSVQSSVQYESEEDSSVRM